MKLKHTKEILNFKGPWLPRRLFPAYLIMARKKGSRKSQVDSGSGSEEVGIYNVERIVTKKIDTKVREN